MTENKLLHALCSGDDECVKHVKEKCPSLDERCLSQMDYFLVGRENFDLEDTPTISYYDDEYIRLGKKLLNEGQLVYNERTGKKCLTYIGDMMKFDLSSCSECFPLLTTKKVFYKPMIAELLGFIRGYNNAEDFRKLGCKIWDANANESRHWLENENRKGKDDLGRIYGVQARNWISPNGEEVDQLKNVIQKLSARIDDRRLIVSHWNPGELRMMALPPCHLLYQFSIINEHLHLTLYQRSADFPLGVPFNIASYALLLKIVARITGLKEGTFTHFLHNIHIYEDQISLFEEQMTRKPYASPTLRINEDIQTLEDLETWVTTDDFTIIAYNHHDAIKFPFSE